MSTMLQSAGMAPADDPQQQQQQYDPAQDPAVAGAPGPSAFTDLSQIDQNLQYMKQVEQGWGLPQLPDQTRLDLASLPNTTHHDLAHFLWGLEGDLNPFSAQAAGATTAAPLQAPSASGLDMMTIRQMSNSAFNDALSSLGSVPNPAYQVPQDPNAFPNQMRALVGGLEGQKAPSVVDPNASSVLMKRAIAYGLVSANTPTTGEFQPANAAIFSQLKYADLQSRMQGNEPGAASIKQLHSSLGDFFDPKHLLNAAWNAAVHSFVPAGHDIEGMLHRAADWYHDPTDPSKFLHMTWSMIPVATPIITDVLLATGVGEVIGAARAAYGAVDTGVVMGDLAAETSYRAAARAATAAAKNQLAETTANAGFGERVAGRLGLGDIGAQRGAYDLARAAEPGYFGSKLAARGGTISGPVSSLMNGWRALAPVGVAKTAVSNIFRVGTVEMAGARLSPGSTLHQSVDHFKLGILDNQYVSPAINVLSVPFAPASTFRPGTLTSVFEPGKQLLSSLAMVGKDNDPVRSTAEVIRGLLAKDAKNQQGVRFADMVKQHANPSDALIAFLGGSAEDAGAFVTHATVHAAIDNEAMATAARMYNDDPVGRKGAWIKQREPIISKLIGIDRNDVGSFLDVMGHKAARDQLGVDKGEISKLAGQLRSDDEAVHQDALDYMNGLIDDHNEKRVGFRTRLLNENIKPGTVEAHVRDYFGNETNWHNYLGANDEARHNILGSGDGVLSADPQLLDEDGRLLRTRLTREPALNLAGQRIQDGDAPISAIASKILDRTLDPDLIKQSWTMPLSRDIVDAAHRFAVAREDTPTSQDMARVLSQFRVLQRIDRSIAYITSNPALQENVANIFRGVGAEENQLVPQGILRSAVAEQLPGAGDKVRRATAVINNLNADSNVPFRALSQENGQFSDLAKASAAIKAQIENLDSQISWDKYGIPPWAKDGSAMSLDKKLNMLRRLMNYTASDVAGVPPEISDRLSRFGYKLVAGAQFVHPQDFQDLVQPLPTVNKWTMRRLSMGTFFQPHENKELNGLLRASLHTHLTDVLVKRNMLDRTALPDAEPFSGDVNDIISRLYARVHDQQNRAEESLQTAKSAGGFKNRIAAQVETTLAPQGLRDLGFSEIKKALPMFNEQDHPGLLNEIYRAILKSHDIGFRYNGLATIEDKIRSYNVLTDGLLLGRTSTGNVLSHLGPADLSAIPKPIKRMAVGGLIGGTFSAGNTLLGQGDTNPDDLIKSFSGGAERMVKYEAMREALAVATTGAYKGLPLLHADPGNWAGYMNLPNALAKIRNIFRFTMSPMFDLRRYTKGALIAQMVADHEGATLPLINRIKGLEKDFGPGAIDEALGMYKAASRGEFQNMEDTEREFSQRGIFNFSPREQMAMTNYRLVQQGIDPEKAYAMTQKIYGYGSGRSAAEKSINFMFFPYSFEKKLMSNSAKFLNDDFARLLLVHDGLKTFDLLDKNYDLSKELKDHVPLLRDMQKLNPYEHGVNLGELYGINAPFIRLFTPFLLNAQGAGVHRGLQSIATRLLPAFNDITRLKQDLENQGHVIFGAHHLTTQAETNAGYNEMNALKLQATATLKAANYDKGLSELRSNPDLADYNAWYENRKGEILAAYPAYAKAIALSAEKAALNQSQLNADLAAGKGGAFETLRLFDEFQKRQTAELKAAGFAASHPEDYPPGTFDDMANAAVWFYKQAASRYGQNEADHFRALYARYFAHQWGPIERPI